jgi:hypothetical protein
MRRYRQTTAPTKEGLLGSAKIVSNPQAKNIGLRGAEPRFPTLGIGLFRQYGAPHSTPRRAGPVVMRAVLIVFAPVATQGEFDGR